jgi:hypothetical protein
MNNGYSNICHACDEQVCTSSFGLCTNCEDELDAYITANPIPLQSEPEQGFDDFDMISCEEIYPEHDA